MYALAGALAAFSSWILVKALVSTSSRWRWWLVYAVVALLSLYTHYFALFMLAAQALFAVIWLWRAYWRRENMAMVRPARVAFAIIGLGFVPWAPTIWHQLVYNGSSRSWIRPLSLDGVYHRVYQILVDPATWPSNSAALVACALLTVVLATTAWRGRPADWCTLALGVGPFALAIGACLSGVQVFVPRYFVPAQLFLLAAAALTAVRIRPPALAGLFAMVALLVSYCVGVDGLTRMDLSRRSGYRGAAAYLDANRLTGEPVIACGGSVYLPIHYHCAQRSGLYVYPRGLGQWIDGQHVLAREEILNVSQLNSWAGLRVWVVNIKGGLSELGEAVPVPSHWQEEHREICMNVFDLRDIEVIAYQIPAAHRR